MIALDINGNTYHHFPINNDLPFTGPSLIADLDGDNDLEIISGSLDNLTVVDVKDLGNTNNYWNIFRGNNRRTGYFLYTGEFECSVSIGDVNGDSMINILDLVQISNYILEFSTPAYPCAADFNGDDLVNILDLVLIANYILDN